MATKKEKLPEADKEEKDLEKPKKKVAVKKSKMKILEPLWDTADVLVQKLELKKWAVENTMNLLDEDNSIPFIARYRKEKTDNMDPDTLRQLQECYEDLKVVKAKISSAIHSIEEQGKMTPQLSTSFRAAKDLHTIEYLYAPYKTGSKRSLAERARELGLEPLSQDVMQGRPPDIARVINPTKEGLTTGEEIQKGIQHILADVVSKDKDVIDKIQEMLRDRNIRLHSSKSRTITKKEKEEAEGKYDPKLHKFENYYDYTIPIRYIKPHQVLAINRGESLKVLTVKVTIPDCQKENFMWLCRRKWIRRDSPPNVQGLLNDSFEDAYKRLIEPLMTRGIRSDLKKTAEKASVEVFGSNLKRLLLTPPVRGKVVLGIDPGFRNGCKYAVTSLTGTVLETGVLYLHTSNHNKGPIDQLRRLITQNRCETIAIGNGTACRETESVLSDLIQQGTFRPLNVQFCIVNEDGASIYSASPEAEKEFPKMDVTLRGAVSIARRLQDPMAELVKIEPKHIGVGMYQHDMPEKQLQLSLDGVVEECVSFVGVDLNVCSEALLRRIAGLNVARAKKIIEWREQNGCFVNRDQLRSVKGLGPKTFEQCAGFVRIIPVTSTTNESACKDEVKEEEKPTVGKKRKAASGQGGPAKKAKTKAVSTDPNPLDMTGIHPESYHIAQRFLEKAEVPELSSIGSDPCIRAVKNYLNRQPNVKSLAADLDVGEPTLQWIVKALQQPLGHDIREEFEKPLFKKGVTSMDSLNTGTVLTGKVTNTTHFGAFVDVGVGRAGLIHVSQMPRKALNGKSGLQLGDKVEVEVMSVDIQKGRISLKLRSVS